MGGSKHVAAPAGGVFTPAALTACCEGEVVVAGDVIGSVESAGRSVDVVCPVSGFLLDLAESGKAVSAGDVVASVV